MTKIFLQDSQHCYIILCLFTVLTLYSALPCTDVILNLALYRPYTQPFPVQMLYSAFPCADLILSLSPCSFQPAPPTVRSALGIAVILWQFVTMVSAKPAMPRMVTLVSVTNAPATVTTVSGTAANPASSAPAAAVMSATDSPQRACVKVRMASHWFNSMKQIWIFLCLYNIYHYYTIMWMVQWSLDDVMYRYGVTMHSDLKKGTNELTNT